MPVWAVKHVPLQDFPFHTSTIRVLASWGDPAYGFSEHYATTLSHTQYLLYYLAGALLAKVFGAFVANKLLISVYLTGTPIAIRSLLRALGRDPRPAIFAIPFVYNALYGLGLLPYLFGIPLLFFGLAATVSHFERPSLRRGLPLAALGIALFYAHVFPFLLFGAGAVALAVTHLPRTLASPKKLVASYAPFLPALAALAHWILFTNMGSHAKGLFSHDPRDKVLTLSASLGSLWNWTGETLRDESDTAFWLAGLFVLGLAGVFAAGDRDDDRRRAWPLVVLPALCTFLFFNTGEWRGPVWLVAQRFPILFVFSLPLFARFPRGGRGMAVQVAAFSIAIGSSLNQTTAYRQFEAQDVGPIEDAIATIAPKSKVATLIFDKYSRTIHWTPFLHYGSFVHEAKGGLHQFTFAGFEHWPFGYLPGEEPPNYKESDLNWPWFPEDHIEEIARGDFYDFVLVRGAPAPAKGAPEPAPPFSLGPRYERAFVGGAWTVWKRTTPAVQKGE